MTDQEQHDLDALLEIAREDQTPLNPRDVEFVCSLDARRDRSLSPRQGDWFDDLVRRHLR